MKTVPSHYHYMLDKYYVKGIFLHITFRAQTGLSLCSGRRDLIVVRHVSCDD